MLVHGLNALLDSWEKHKPKPIRKLIGKYVVPKDLFNVNMGTYRVTDAVIASDALKYPQDIPPFITLMKPNYSATVRKEDLKRFEENSRRSLLILSSLDATLLALIRAYPGSKSPDTSACTVPNLARFSGIDRTNLGQSPSSCNPQTRFFDQRANI